MSRTRATPFEVSGRTVFITGAARGIGAATAERLHRKGANVALVGLEPERLRELAARLGDRAAAFEADVTDFDALQRAVASTVERFGGIDVAIANAGHRLHRLAGDAPIEQVERTLAVNLLGVWRTDRAVIEQITAAPRLPAEHLLAVGDRARADDGRLHHRQGGRGGAQRRVCAWRPLRAGRGRLRLLRLHRHRSRARRLRPALGRSGNGSSPSFMRNPGSAAKAIDAIERGIERRSARVWAPRWVGPMIALARCAAAADRTAGAARTRAPRRGDPPGRPAHQLRWPSRTRSSGVAAQALKS